MARFYISYRFYTWPPYSTHRSLRAQRCGRVARNDVQLQRPRSIFADGAAVRAGRCRRRVDVRFRLAGYEPLMPGVWYDSSTDAAYSLLGGQLDYVSPA